MTLSKRHSGPTPARLILLLFLICAANLRADDNSGIIDGTGYAFIIAAPKGWKLTSTRDMPAAFYPAGSSLEKSSVIMYINPVKKAASASTIPEINLRDLNAMQRQHPNAVSKKIGSAKDRSGRDMPLYTCSGGGYSELMAYCDERETVTVFVVSAANDAQLKAARPAFDKLLASYVVMDTPVHGRGPKK